LGLLAAGQLVGDTARAVYFIHEVSLRQAITPDHLLGRMNASVEFLVNGIGPLGLLVGGLLGESIGMRTTLVIAALGNLAGCLWLVASPVLAWRGHPQV
jgi:hypothetical protein